MRNRLRRLEQAAKDELVSIPQPDGSFARFPQKSLGEAFVRNVDILTGSDIEPHPLAIAAAKSPDRSWSGSFYAACWPENVRPVEDLSE